MILSLDKIRFPKGQGLKKKSLNGINQFLTIFLKNHKQNVSTANTDPLTPNPAGEEKEEEISSNRMSANFPFIKSKIFLDDKILMR